MLGLFRTLKARKRLAATLRPDPDYRERRLAQFSPERRARYFENIKKAGL